MRSPSKSLALIFPLALIATSWGQPSRGAILEMGKLGEKFQSKIQNSKSKIPSLTTKGAAIAVSDNFILVSTVSGIKLQNISSRSDVTLIANSGNITVGNISSGSNVTLIAKNGNITVGNIKGSRIELSSTGSIEGGTFGGISTSLVKLSSATSHIKVNAISSGASGGIVDIKAKGIFQATGTLKSGEFDLPEQNPQVSIFAQTPGGSTSSDGGYILIQYNGASTSQVPKAKDIIIEGKGGLFVVGPKLKLTARSSGTTGGIYIGAGQNASIANKLIDRSLGSSNKSTTGSPTGKTNNNSSIEQIHNLGQKGNAHETAPPNNSKAIASIRIRFLDRRGLPTRGQTRPFIITREFDLQPGDVYDQKLAQQGLQRVFALNSVRRASIILKPTIDPQRVVMVVNVVERSSITASLDTGAPAPSALQGPFQPQPVRPGADIDSGFSVGGSVQLRNLGGNNQNLVARVTAGEQVLNGELSFTDPWIAGDRHRTGYTINIFNQRAVQSVFTGGDRDIDLPNGDDPWVHRLGGGVQFFRPLTPSLTAALGLSYQRVSIRDGMFSSKLQPRDELNNPLTFSNSGQDDLLTLNLSAQLDRRNDKDNPTRGSRLLFGIDQSIPVGEANILFTRLSANYLQYIPLPLFGFTKGPRTLILNLQTGTMLGDVPGYEAFNLGAGLTRGFSGNAIGTGRSFVEATAEYRFPISVFQLFNQPIDLGGVLFVDYASDLNTASTVLGEPAIVRDKPGSGLGYGVGLRAKTSLGTAWLEFAWSEQGESQVIFTLGDRF